MKKASKNDTVAIVVTYNRIKLLQECIEALKKNGCDILIIDNASTDGTKETIASKYKKDVIYINTGANLGGAGGFNFGIRKAYELGYKFFWIMDDDCIVRENTLKEFKKADKKYCGNYGFLSSKVLWKDGTICKMNIPKRTFGSWLRVEKIDKNTKIAMASFVSLFIKSEVVREFGLPIKDFFIWTDDWEFTRRISRKKNCYYIPTSVVTHKSNNNIGADLSNENGERLERFKYLYRNDYVLYRREGVRGLILLRLRIAKHILKILTSRNNDKMKRIKIMHSALRTGKKYNPEIEYV